MPPMSVVIGTQWYRPFITLPLAITDVFNLTINMPKVCHYKSIFSIGLHLGWVDKHKVYLRQNHIYSSNIICEYGWWKALYIGELFFNFKINQNSSQVSPVIMPIPAIIFSGTIFPTSFDFAQKWIPQGRSHKFTASWRRNHRIHLLSYITFL